MMTKKQIKQARKQTPAPPAPREPAIFPLLPDETILPDDYPIRYDYVYLVDGVFRRNDYGDSIVGSWRAMNGIKEVRRCSLFARPEARLGDKVQLP